MAEAQLTPEGVISAVKKETPLHEAVKKGATVEMGRGRNRRGITLRGEQMLYVLMEDATRKIVVEKSRKLVPDREDRNKPPTEAEITREQETTEALLADIDAKAGKRKQTYDEIAGRIGPSKMNERRVAYEKLAMQRVEKQIAASERGVLANEIKKGYSALAGEVMYAHAIADLPPVQKQDKNGRSIQESPKEQFIRLLASEGILTDVQKQHLREKLQGVLSDFSNEFIGNDVVEKFKNSLHTQWEAPQQPVEEVVEDSQTESTRPEEQDHTLEVRSDSGEEQTPSVEAQARDTSIDIDTIEGVDHIIGLLDKRLRLLNTHDIHARTPLEDARRKFTTRRSSLKFNADIVKADKYAVIQPYVDHIRDETSGEVRIMTAADWQQFLQEEEVIPYTYDPEYPTLDTVEGAEQLLTAVQARLKEIGYATPEGASLWGLEWGLRSYVGNKKGSDPGRNNYSWERYYQRKNGKSLTKELQEMGYIKEKPTSVQEVVQTSASFDQEKPEHVEEGVIEAVPTGEVVAVAEPVTSSEEKHEEAQEPEVVEVDAPASEDRDTESSSRDTAVVDDPDVSETLMEANERAEVPVAPVTQFWGEPPPPMVGPPGYSPEIKNVFEQEGTGPTVMAKLIEQNGAGVLYGDIPLGFAIPGFSKNKLIRTGSGQNSYAGAFWGGQTITSKTEVNNIAQYLVNKMTPAREFAQRMGREAPVFTANDLLWRNTRIPPTELHNKYFVLYGDSYNSTGKMVSIGIPLPGKRNTVNYVSLVAEVPYQVSHELDRQISKDPDYVIPLLQSLYPEIFNSKITLPPVKEVYCKYPHRTTRTVRIRKEGETVTEEPFEFNPAA